MRAKYSNLFIYRSLYSYSKGKVVKKIDNIVFFFYMHEGV